MIYKDFAPNLFMKDEYATFILNDKQTYLFTKNKNQYIESVRDIFNEDYKTSITQKQDLIPSGTILKVEGWIENLYGRYLEVIYNNTLYYVDASNFNYIGEIK